MSKEDSLYQEAMEHIGDLVDEVIQRCYDVAEENDFEKEWVLGQFRSAFNKAKRNCE